MNLSLEQKDTYVATLFVVLGAALFSCKGILIKVIFSLGLSPLQIMVLRMGIALPFYLFLLIFSYQRLKPRKLNPIDAMGMSLLGLWGYHLASGLDFEGLKYVSAGLERITLFLYPTFVVVLQFLFFQKPIGRTTVISLLLSYLGLLFAYGGELSAESSNKLLGTSLIALSALAYSIFMIYGARMIQRYGSLFFTAWAMSSATIGILIQAGMMGFHFQTSYTPVSIASCAVLAIFCTVIASFLMNAGIEKLGASKASILSSVGPVVTVAIGWFFLNEKFSILGLFGILLVSVGGLSTTLIKTKKTARN